MKLERMFDITVKTQVPLRIGGPDDPLAGGKKVVGRVGDRLVIPGSTLKGAYRAALEIFLIDQYYDADAGKWAAGDEAKQPCVPAAKPSPDERRLIESGRYKHQTCAYTENKYSQAICPCCYLLGAMGIQGFVRVPFLYADATANQLYTASLDRATGTVRGGTNFAYELVPEGVAFAGRLSVTIRNTVLGWDLGRPREYAGNRTQDAWLRDRLLDPDEVVREWVVARLKSITLIGGYKSKGFGDVSLEVREVTQ